MFFLKQAECFAEWGPTHHFYTQADSLPWNIPAFCCGHLADTRCQSTAFLCSVLPGSRASVVMTYWHKCPVLLHGETTSGLCLLPQWVSNNSKSIWGVLLHLFILTELFTHTEEVKRISFYSNGTCKWKVFLPTVIRLEWEGQGRREWGYFLKALKYSTREKLPFQEQITAHNYTYL